MTVADRLDRLAAFLAAHIELAVGGILLCTMAFLTLREHLIRYRPPRRFVSKSAERKAHKNGEQIRARTRPPTLKPQTTKRPELENPLPSTTFVGTLF